jgi:hypothetical protein
MPRPPVRTRGPARREPGPRNRVQWNPADHLAWPEKSCASKSPMERGGRLERSTPPNRNTKSDELKDLAQVRGRYIGGLREVNRRTRTECLRPTGPPHRAVVYLNCEIRYGRAESPIRSSSPCIYASGGNYGLYLPLQRKAAGRVCSMFARLSRYALIMSGTGRQRNRRVVDKTAP